MSKKFLVHNRTDRTITEYKPGLGNFAIKSHEKLELKEDIARAIVSDFQAPGLVLEIVEDVVLKKLNITPKVVKPKVEKSKVEVKTLGKREENKQVPSK